jgi:hypothetical protein
LFHCWDEMGLVFKMNKLLSDRVPQWMNTSLRPKEFSWSPLVCRLIGGYQYYNISGAGPNQSDRLTKVRAQYGGRGAWYFKLIQNFFFRRGVSFCWKSVERTSIRSAESSVRSINGVLGGCHTPHRQQPPQANTKKTMCFVPTKRATTITQIECSEPPSLLLLNSLPEPSFLFSSPP